MGERTERRCRCRALLLVCGLAWAGCGLRPGPLRAQGRADSARAGRDSAAAQVAGTTPVFLIPAITITAARTAPQSPTSTVQVGAERVRQALATSSNTWELLRQTAGLEVHEQGQGPGFASDASIRGFSSDHSTDLALWVDGVPINEPMNGHAEGYNDWSLLFPQAIRNVEVIEGPSSPLFGNFALAGVVNVQTLERIGGAHVWLTGGSRGEREGALLAGLDRPATGLVVGVRGQQDTGWRPHGDWRLGQGYVHLVHDMSSTVSLDLGAGYYGASWDSPGFLTLAQFAARDYGVVANPTDQGGKRRGQQRASLQVDLSRALVWRTTVYGTESHWTLYLTTPPEGGSGEGSGSQTEERDQRWGAGLTSALTWRMPRAEITLGTQEHVESAFYEKWFTTARVRDSTDQRVSGRQLAGSVFGEVLTDVAPRLRLSLGGRWDLLQDRSRPQGARLLPAPVVKTVLSPKLGILWRPPGLPGIYASVSRGFRDPDGVLSEPGLPFITEWAYEAGLKLDGRPGSARLSVFRMDVSDEQSFNPVTLTSTSGGASRRQGAELEAALRAGAALTLRTSVTYDDARYLSLVTEDGESLRGAPVFNTARYVGAASAELAPAGGVWRLRVAGNAVGPYAPFDVPRHLDSAFGLLHVSGGVRVAGARLELGVRNVLDRAYMELRAGDYVAPGEPRTFTLTLSRAFGR